MSVEIAVGLTSIQGTVTGLNGVRLDIEFLIDSGAKYTLLPHEVWTTLSRSLRNGGCAFSWPT